MIGEDKIYLFNIEEDNIEACNIAEEHMEIVQELLEILDEQISSYEGSGLIYGDKGSYLAMRDSYNCDNDTFFYVKSDKPEYNDDNIEMDWNDVLLSIVDKVSSCD